MSKSLSRGLRNNNPGNIRLSGSTFRGEVTPSRDISFKEFRSLAWGYRAMFVILNTYTTRYHLTTVRGMISRWAPPLENNTEGYIAVVSRVAQLDPDTPVDTLQRAVMLPLVDAMSYVENGEHADWLTIERGWELFEECS